MVLVPNTPDQRLTQRSVAAGLGLALAGLGLALAARGMTSEQVATPTGLPPALAEWTAGWQSLDSSRVAAIRANLGALMTVVPDADAH